MSYALVLQDPSLRVYFGQDSRVQIPPEKVFGALGMEF